MDRHGYSLEDLFARRLTPAFREVMRDAVARAREFFGHGLPLAGLVDRGLALDIDLFSRGGLRVLEKIIRRNYDVLSERPVISRGERAWLLLASMGRLALRRGAG